MSSDSFSRHAQWTFVAWWLMTIASTAAVGQGTVINREYAIKAAFLYHFSNYIEWSASDFASADAPFVIGVLGANPFGNAVHQISDKKKVDGRPIEVRVVNSLQEVLNCQILFVPQSVPLAKQNVVLQETRHHPVLMVGEQSDFIERGGNVQFFLEGNKVRFAFGAEAIKRDDLRVSSKLLALAKIIASP